MRDRKASRPGGLEWAASKARAARCSGVPCAVVALTGGAVCAGSELAKKVSARTAEARNLKYPHTILSSRLVFRSNRHEFTPRLLEGTSRFRAPRRHKQRKQWHRSSSKLCTPHLGVHQSRRNSVQ